MIRTNQHWTPPPSPAGAWGRRLFLLGFGLLVAWEGILNGYKLSHFPLEAIDFFQHYFLGWWVRYGGSYADPSWATQVAAWGLRLPPSIQSAAPYLSYQPLLLPFFRFLAALPPTPAAALWASIQTLLLVCAGIRLARTIGISPLKVAGGILLWPPVWHVLNLGNVDVSVAACLMVGLADLAQNRWLRGGFWLGIAAAFKGIPAFAALPWLLHRRSAARVGAGLFLGTGLCVLLSFLSVKGEGIRFLLTHFSAYRAALVSFSPANGSLLALLAALASPQFWTEDGYLYQGWFPGLLPIQELSLALGALLFGWGVWWSARHFKKPTLLHSGFWLSLGLVIWPVSWVNYHLYLIPALVQALYQRQAFSPATRRWLVIPLFLISVGISWRLLTTFLAPWMAFPPVMVATHLCLAAFFARAIKESQGETLGPAPDQHESEAQVSAVERHE